MKPLVLTAVTLAALTGCTAAPEPLGEVSVINEVVKAYEDAGGACDWHPTGETDGFYSSGDCSPTTAISIYATTAERDEAVDRILAAAKATGNDAMLLVGENWILNSPDAEPMRAVLGGELVASE